MMKFRSKKIPIYPKNPHIRIGKLHANETNRPDPKRKYKKISIKRRDTTSGTNRKIDDR